MTDIPEIPFGAIENGRVFLQRLADHYDFTCEAGPLANCIEYHEAVRCFEVIAQFASESTAALPYLSAPCAVDVAAVRRQAFEEAKKAIADLPLGYNDDVINGEENAYRAVEALPRADPAQHPDDAAVDNLARLMKAKLAQKRREGRSGWQGMSADELTAILRQHVDKGDPVDVANLCMMLSGNGQRIAPAEPAQGEQWQPIETAPKDGSFVDLFDKEGCRRADCRWFTNSSQFTAWHQQKGGRAFNIGADDSFTHWMRSPAAPTTEAGK